MSKTAGCVFALGVCMVLAAACGDDEGGPATGENGGAAGAGGRAGSGNAGRAGAAGAGGALGGAAGVGGAPGGAGGSSAGAAGAGAGNGGSAGAGGDPDGGAPDGSTGPQGNCPAFPASALQIVPQTEQQIAIARVLFLADGSADVVIRNISPVAGDAGDTSFFIGDPLELCSGPANCAIMEDICDEAGFDLQLLAGEEATCNIDAIAAEGELGVMSTDVVVPEAFSFAYLAWDQAGGFVSQPPVDADAGVPTSLEDRAANRDGPDFWTLDQRIAVTAGEDTIVGTGETDVAAGFVSCDR